MARKRGIFSRGSSAVGAAGLGGIFNAVNAAETINNNRAARAESARRTDVDRVMAGLKLKEAGRPSQVITFGPDGKPQVSIQPGTAQADLDVLGGILGLPPSQGGQLPPSKPGVVPPPRTPSSIPESPAQKTARDILGQTFSAQNKFADVDEQTADSAVQAGAIVGVPVTKETIKPGGVMGFLGMGKPKFRISIDDGGLAALSGVPAAPPSGAPAPRVPPSASTAAPRPMPGGKIRVSNGREILLIDPADEAEAAADGYRRI